MIPPTRRPHRYLWPPRPADPCPCPLTLRGNQKHCRATHCGARGSGSLQLPTHPSDLPTPRTAPQPCRNVKRGFPDKTAGFPRRCRPWRRIRQRLRQSMAGTLGFGIEPPRFARQARDTPHKPATAVSEIPAATPTSDSKPCQDRREKQVMATPGGAECFDANRSADVREAWRPAAPARRRGAPSL